uniref:DDE_3 domain-containing protein n=1 Tax=Caenorhabditis tropicalis TaxID=1561998 RepID=A0A1I7TTW3_9PELO
MAQQGVESRGGRNALKKYEVDEFAATLVVKIVRLPPYHCQFSPIELTWNQLKSHIRAQGKTTDKIPAKNWKKQDYMTQQGVAVIISKAKEEIWAEVEDYINSRGGKNELKRYEVDECSATFGVEVVRLPPYHCQFSPIELIWIQLKSNLRAQGKTTDKVEVVRQATEWLKNLSEPQIAWTYEHIIEIENYIRMVMENDNSEDEDDL